MNKNIKKVLVTVIAVVIISVPAVIFAESGGGKVSVNLKDANPIKSQDLISFASCLISSVVKIAAVVVIFFMIYAGFLYVTARGNESQVTKAHNTLLWTVVGALLILGAQSLSVVVCNTAKDLGADVNCSFVNAGCK